MPLLFQPREVNTRDTLVVTATATGTDFVFADSPPSSVTSSL
jgi:hypothetical protein